MAPEIWIEILTLRARISIQISSVQKLRQIEYLTGEAGSWRWVSRVVESWRCVSQEGGPGGGSRRKGGSGPGWRTVSSFWRPETRQHNNRKSIFLHTRASLRVDYRNPNIFSNPSVAGDPFVSFQHGIFRTHQPRTDTLSTHNFQCIICMSKKYMFYISKIYNYYTIKIIGKSRETPKRVLGIIVQSFGEKYFSPNFIIFARDIFHHFD